MGRVSARDGNGLLLPPDNAWLGDKVMSLDEVRLEGLRRCWILLYSFIYLNRLFRDNFLINL